MRWLPNDFRLRFAKEQTAPVLLIAAYVATGKLGLMLPSALPDHAPVISLVWAPAGIALGAFVVLGYKIWPLVLAGSTLLYATTNNPLSVVLAMSAGNTVEGLLTAYLINRFAGGRNALQSPENTVRFSGLIILSCTTISATCAATSLALTGLVGWNEYGRVWTDASLGNMTGSLLVAPLVLLWSQSSTTRWRPRRAIEGCAVLLCVFLVGLTVFCGFPNELKGYPLEFLCMPVLLWTAFRLGRRSTAIAILILAGLAVYGTLNGYGPFMRSDPTVALMMVQIFMSMTGVMTMALAALGSEYQVAEAQLRELVVTDPLTGLPN